MIAIKYLAPGRRELDGFVWSPENGHICEVDAETAAQLLTYPTPQFELAPNAKASKPEVAKLAALLGVSQKDVLDMFTKGDVPVAPSLEDIEGLSDGRREQFADQFGIKTVSDLAKADPKKLIGTSGASAAQINDWIGQAKALAD